MKTAFMGTPDFAVPTLERLIESRHKPAFAVCQPSKPKGRGLKPVDPPVKVAAEKRGIPVYQPASLKKDPAIENLVREQGIDLLVVAAYGKLLPKSLLDAPRLGCLNVHASILPEYRGAAPIQRAIMDGRLETGVTIMKMTERLDAGPIVSQQTIEIEPDDDALSVSNYLSVLGADMLIRALDEIESTGKIEAVEQDESLATLAPMIAKEEGEIDWTLSSEQIMFRLRALTPWPGLYTWIGGKRAKIIQAEPMEAAEAAHHGAVKSAAPGTVAGIEKEFGFIVKTGSGYLLVTRLQPEGKAAMEAPAFLNGYPLKVGARLGAPEKP